MAQVAILIEDIDAGGVQVNVSTDTEIADGDDAELTTAQAVGTATMIFLQNLVSNEAKEEAPPSLEVIGDVS